MPFGGKGNDPRHPPGVIGATAQNMGKEAVQSCQPIIAGGNAVVAVALKVFEEVDNQRGIKICETQLVNRYTPRLFDILEEQAQGLAIVRDRARTGAANAILCRLSGLPSSRSNRVVCGVTTTCCCEGKETRSAHVRCGRKPHG